jgi:hypothetical protein
LCYAESTLFDVRFSCIDKRSIYCNVFLLAQFLPLIPRAVRLW